MADAIKLSVTGDTQALVDAVKKGAIAVEDLQDALKDTGKTGDRSGDQITGAMADSQRDTRELKSDIERATDAFDKAGRAGRDLGSNVKYGTDDAKDGIREIGDEAASTAKESAASFDGSAASIGDAFQEVAANAFAGFGPAGLAAGVLAAAGIGTVFAEIEKGNEKTEAAKQKVQELGQEYIEAGGIGERSLEGVLDALKELATTTEEGAVSLKSLRDAGEDADRQLDDIARAYTGNSDALQDYVRDLEDQLATLEELSGTYDITTEAGQKLDNQNLNQAEGVRELIGVLQDQLGVTKDAEQAERDYIESGAAALDARQQRADALQDIIDESIGSFEDYKNAETGAFDPGAYIAAMEARRVATSNFNTNVQSIATQFGLTDAEVQTILDQGLDFAPMLQSIIDSGLSDEFASEVRAGADGGQAILDGKTLTADVEADTSPATSSVADWFRTNASKPATKVQITAETKLAENAIKTVTEKPYKANIVATTDTQAASSSLTALTSTRVVRVVVDLDLNQANREMSAFLSKSRTAVVTGKVVLP